MSTTPAPTVERPDPQEPLLRVIKALRSGEALTPEQRVELASLLERRFT